MIIGKTKEVKIELLDTEIQIIIDELKRVPHNLYTFMNYEKIIKKLKVEVENKWFISQLIAWFGIFGSIICLLDYQARILIAFWIGWILSIINIWSQNKLKSSHNAIKEIK